MEKINKVKTCMNCMHSQRSVMDGGSPCFKCFKEVGVRPAWVSATDPTPRKRAPHDKDVIEADLLAKYRKKYQEIKRLWRRIDNALADSQHYADGRVAKLSEEFEEALEMRGMPRRTEPGMFVQYKKALRRWKCDKG